jgi:hypothetical protein
VFLAIGGKGYYLAGLYPLLVAAGAVALEPWLARRRATLAAALLLTGAVNAVVGLPLVPVARLAATPVPVINPEAAETVGWPALVRTVGAVAPPGAVVLTANYGEAGALQVLGHRRAYSGHNAYWLWGPPPERDAPLVLVGRWPDLGWLCADPVRLAAIDNGVGVRNEEQGAPVTLCRGRRVPWRQAWPRLRKLS